jgi:hypothetical protein
MQRRKTINKIANIVADNQTFAILLKIFASFA